MSVNVIAGVMNFEEMKNGEKYYFPSLITYRASRDPFSLSAAVITYDRIMNL